MPTEYAPEPNRDFGPLIDPLLAPTYVLRMARHRRWSREARVRHVRRYRETLVEALARTDAWLERHEEIPHA